MGGNSDIELMRPDGKRLDGREKDEMRPLKIEAGVLHRASGSAYLEWGRNKVMAAVYGPREAIPRHSQDPLRAVVKCRYNMAPFSVNDRKRPGPDRRSNEIGKVASEAFANVVVLEDFPRTQVDVIMEVLEADAGTRCAGITAAAVALADAGIPMRGMVSACAAGKAGGNVILDLDQPEDNFGEADVPLAMNMTTGEVVLLQMDGHLTEDEFETALKYAMKGCKDAYEIQKDALKRRYASETEIDGGGF